jgi:hypothetical protein
MQLVHHSRKLQSGSGLVVGLTTALISVGALAFLIVPSNDEDSAEGLEQAERPRESSAHNSVDALFFDDKPDAGQRGEVTGSVEEEPESKTATTEQEKRIGAAVERLTFHADESLNGALYLNDVLDQMLEVASLPTEDRNDMEFEDDDAMAYRLQGTPEGTDAHFLVGLQPYDEEGKTFRYLQMNVEMGAGKTEYLRDSVRRGPHISLSISFDEADEETPTRFALVMTRPVALSESRKAGIDAYHGQFTTGAQYWIDLKKDPDNPVKRSIGIVNGNPVRDYTPHGGLNPLVGDTELDRERLSALLVQLQKNYAVTRGKQ